ncbi:MAG: hypothetical protein FJX68_01200 [Alphaproteobacteria bacterium]|nr:hypothetical protein [Alphaproteobacteria bacterium]
MLALAQHRLDHPAGRRVSLELRQAEEVGVALRSRAADGKEIERAARPGQLARRLRRGFERTLHGAPQGSLGGRTGRLRRRLADGAKPLPTVAREYQARIGPGLRGAKQRSRRQSVGMLVPADLFARGGGRQQPGMAGQGLEAHPRNSSQRLGSLDNGRVSNDRRQK